MRNSALTFEDVVVKIDQLNETPIAVEAQWDGDTQGWFIRMYVITQTNNNSSALKFETHHLGIISLGGDFRLFTGTVPPFPEAKIASDIGKKLEEKYGIEFFFPSPIQPNSDCPKWVEKDNALKCADCGILIMTTYSSQLSDAVCYNCNLKRNHNYRIKTADSLDGYANVILIKNGEYIITEIASNFKKLVHLKFSDYKLPASPLKEVEIIKIRNEQIEPIVKYYEEKIDLLLLNYNSSDIENKRLQLKEQWKKNPELTGEKWQGAEIEKRLSERINPIKVTYKGKEYELADFVSFHTEALRLLHFYFGFLHAYEKKYEYHIYLKNGFTYRDVSVLRYIMSVKEGKVNTTDVASKFKEILDEVEVQETINKLKKFKCLEFNGTNINVTQLGQNLL